MRAAIEASGISFTYPDGTEALSGVDIMVAEGERVALVGPNGAGKSTLLLLLAGLRKPKAGSIRIFGLEMEEGGRLPRPDVGIVFQDPDDQIFMPTVEEDIGFGPTNQELPEGEIQGRVEDAVIATGLRGFERRAPHHLSAGEKKRVAIAGVLAMSPRIMLLDEPTAGLDPRGKESVMGLMRKLGGTIVLVTHDMDLALEFSERIVLLKGKVLFDGRSRELFERIDLIELADLATPKISEIAAILRQKKLLGSEDHPRSIDELRDMIGSG